MASWAHILLLFGGVMAVAWILPAILKLVYRAVSGLLFFALALLAISVYTGTDINRLLSETLGVLGNLLRELAGRIS